MRHQPLLTHGADGREGRDWRGKARQWRLASLKGPNPPSRPKGSLLRPQKLLKDWKTLLGPLPPPLPSSDAILGILDTPPPLPAIPKKGVWAEVLKDARRGTGGRKWRRYLRGGTRRPLSNQTGPTEGTATDSSRRPICLRQRQRKGRGTEAAVGYLRPSG